MTRFAPLLLALTAVCVSLVPPQDAPEPADHDCGVELQRTGAMHDILSNALTLGRRFDERRVNGFLERTQVDCANGPELLRRAAVEFGLSESELAADVERFRHVNCGVEAIAANEELSAFAADVAVHVVLHELGHALIREFDLPVLGNEETMADAFATHFLATHLPERALDVLSARVDSLMQEANEVPREQWSVRGEHDHDARRAHQIAALAVAADPERYRVVAHKAGLSDDDVKDARDYGAEIHRSWRRILQPLWMPERTASNEARVVFEGAFAAQPRAEQLAAELENALRRFDWHSQVTLRFAEGDGGAGWNRSKRTITVHDAYLQRFIEQGRQLAK